MSHLSFFRSLCAASLFTLFAGSALADDSYVLDLAPAASGASSASFSANVVGLFVDSYSFTPATFNGNVDVTLTSTAGPVHFFVGGIGDNSFAFLDDLGTGIFEASFMSTVTAATPLSVTVFGAVLDADGNPAGAGSYNIAVSTATVSAVPEPRTAALLLVGLLMVGMVSRRQPRRWS